MVRGARAFGQVSIWDFLPAGSLLNAAVRIHLYIQVMAHVATIRGMTRSARRAPCVFADEVDFCRRCAPHLAIHFVKGHG
jgi:hypothetical protein